MNHLSVPTSVLSCDTKHCRCNMYYWHLTSKWKDNVKKKSVFIYRYNNSYINSEEAAIWLPSVIDLIASR